MQHSVIFRIFIAVTVRLVYDNKKLFIRPLQTIVMNQGFRYFATAKHSTRKTELVLISVPTRLQVWGRHYNGTQTEIVSNGRGDDTLAQAHYVSHNRSVVCFDRLQCKLDGISLVFQVKELTIGNVERCTHISLGRNVKILVEHS